MLYIVIWEAYGKWKSTMPFDTEREAEEHIRRYLRTPERDYNKKITIVPVPKPE